MFASLEMCNHRFKGDTAVENVRRDEDIGWNKRSRKKDLEKIRKYESRRETAKITKTQMHSLNHLEKIEDQHSILQHSLNRDRSLFRAIIDKSADLGPSLSSSSQHSV